MVEIVQMIEIKTFISLSDIRIPYKNRRNIIAVKIINNISDDNIY